MSRVSRLRAQRERAAQQAKLALKLQSPVPRASLWLSLAFLLPNLGILACGFVLDDVPVIVANDNLHIHSLRQLAKIWVSGYWPDRNLLPLYRPVSQTLWALIWAIGGESHPALFHLVDLVLGLAVVLLLYRFLLDAQTPPRIAFIAALLFALFPIHTDATASVVGSAELLAATFGLGALILYYRRQPVPALFLFALAIFSKESAAAFAALPLAFPRQNVRFRAPLLTAAGAAAMIALALLAHHLTGNPSGRTPPVDNPMVLVDDGPRIFTALWIQCLYLVKTVLPVTLSADYSYKQISLVMGLDSLRAWAGLALAGGALLLAWRRREYRPPVLAYAILFSPTANLLFPVGTIMAERLAYTPTLGLALLLAIPLAQSRYWKAILLAVALAFGARTAVRNLDWRDADHFYTKLLRTAPDSAKSYYFYGALRAARGDDAGAVQAYDRAIAVFPAYSEAYFNRGNALARLGKRTEAMASYRDCLRFDAGHSGAARNLHTLEAGLPLYPSRARL